MNMLRPNGIAVLRLSHGRIYPFLEIHKMHNATIISEQAVGVNSGGTEICPCGRRIFVKLAVPAAGGQRPTTFSLPSRASSRVRMNGVTVICPAHSVYRPVLRS